MLNIKGIEHIVLPHVNAIIVSSITPLGKPDDGHSYQRELVFVTDEGTLTITLTAKERETISFAADPLVSVSPLPAEED